MLVTDQRQVAGDGGVLGQRSEGGLGQAQFEELAEVDLGAVDLGVDAVVLGHQRMDLAHIAYVHAADGNLGAAAGVIGRIVLYGGVLGSGNPQRG